jgi:hypothetical protein
VFFFHAALPTNHQESPAFTSLLANESGWAAHVRSGLQSIVTSKLGADMRGAGLALAAAAMERLGCDWMLIAGPKDTKGKAPMTAGAAREYCGVLGSPLVVSSFLCRSSL